MTPPTELGIVLVALLCGGCARGVLSRAVPRTAVGRKLRWAKAGLWYAVPFVIWVLKQ